MKQDCLLPRFVRIAGVVVSLGFCLFVISACSSANLSMPIPDRLVLLPPSGGPSPVLLKQKVTFDKAGRQQQFLVVSRINSQQVDLVILLATGQKVLSVSYNGVSFSQQQHLSANIPGEEILALVQFVLWPEFIIRQHYRQEDGWILAFEEGRRSILTRVGVWVTVEHRAGSIIVENYSQNYRVVIELIDSLDL